MTFILAALNNNIILIKFIFLTKNPFLESKQINKMPPKKPSGAEYKKLRQIKTDEVKKIVTPIKNFFSVVIRSKPNTVSDSSIIDESTASSSSLESNVNVLNLETEEKNDPISHSCNPLNSVEILGSAELPPDFNDPQTWTKDNLRICVEHGPDPGDDIHVYPIVSNRQFDKKWFYKVLANGETIRRSWLIYCRRNDSLYCFPCKLFDQRIFGVFCETGFSDWKHLNPAIPRHENSLSHKENYLKWKEFERGIKRGTLIDDKTEKLILTEKQKWRHILNVILDAILYCIKNNDALRGSSEIIGHPNFGKFLNTIDYDPIIANHIISHNKNQISYFSPSIQNELINLIGKKEETRLFQM